MGAKAGTMLFLCGEGTTLFLCGDVMTGRGIDQILPHPVDPALYEPRVRDARAYVRLAEERTGPIKAPVGFDYVWGDALEVLERVGPGVRLINLETSVTTSDEPWEGKGIHYRMHPANVDCLTSAGIDCCVLANNHVLDWGSAGLLETLRTLEEAGIRTAGAGRDAAEAAAPAVLGAGEQGRVLVLAFGSPTGGVPPEWAATAERPGVNVLPDFSDEAVREVAATVERHARDGDVVLVSVHWGGNWGYTIPQEQIDFARRLVDEAGVDVIHGHSSHHVKGLEVYKGRLILYGCGDFLNDYEGIGGYERYRPDLTLMYFPTVAASTGALTGLRLAPMQIQHFRLNRASRADAVWLRDALNRESAGFGVHVVLEDDGMLAVHWGWSPNDDPMAPVTARQHGPIEGRRGQGLEMTVTHPRRDSSAGYVNRGGEGGGVQLRSERECRILHRRTVAMSEHTATIEWRRETAGFTYDAYNRDHDWTFDSGVTVRASATPDYRGNALCVDPEEAFVASLASCHMLTFLALAARKRYVVDAYRDQAVGVLGKDPAGNWAMTRVILRPEVRFGGEVTPSDEELRQLHDRAHHGCFIANSVKSEVIVEPR